MINNKYKSHLHRVFKISIIVKGVDGILDIIASILLYLSPSKSIEHIIPLLFRKELIEDPKDIIANFFLNASHNLLPDTQIFLIIFLLVHGVIKGGLALALNSKNRRAYIYSGIILIFFIGYQIYRFSHTHSFLLLMFTLIDIVMVLLIHNELKRFPKSKT
jgi:uncharacterized membrane protein